MKRYFLINAFLLFIGFKLYAQTNTPASTSQSPAATGNTTSYQPAAYTLGAAINYIKTWQPRKPLTNESDVVNSTTVTDVNHATQYIDGLGRPIQTVSWQSSPNKTDVVAPVVFDAFGREQYKYMPYTSTTSDGSFQINPFGDQNSFYSSTY